MSFLRWCGAIKSASSSKVFLSSLQNRLNSVGLRSFKNVPSQAKICLQPQQKLSPLVIKCSILGVSGYLCIRYLDLKSFLPTAYCREAPQDHAPQFQVPEGNGEGPKNGDANGKKAEDTFPIRQFLRYRFCHCLLFAIDCFVWDIHKFQLKNFRTPVNPTKIFDVQENLSLKFLFRLVCWFPTWAT